LNMRHAPPLYLGVDCDRFAAGEKTFTADRATILCTRWFEPVYDNLTIVRAFAAAHRRMAGARMIFASSGSQIAEAERLWLALGDAGRPEAASFLGGVEQAELVAQLRAADIYVSMSSSDGTSTSLLEAFSAGLFPILSDIPANREWLATHGCMGILVPVGDAQALELAMIEAIGDPERRSRAARHNLDIVRKLADARTNRKILLDELSAAARSNPRSSHSGIG